MRILISYEDSYHVYSDTLERALGALRPDGEVAACRLTVLGEQVESFNPHLVVSSCKNTVDPGGRRPGTGSPLSPTDRLRPASAGGVLAGTTRP
jgi:hypothetical protein